MNPPFAFTRDSADGTERLPSNSFFVAEEERFFHFRPRVHDLTLKSRAPLKRIL